MKLKYSQIHNFVKKGSILLYITTFVKKIFFIALKL